MTGLSSFLSLVDCRGIEHGVEVLVLEQVIEAASLVEVVVAVAVAVVVAAVVVVAAGTRG